MASTRVSTTVLPEELLSMIFQLAYDINESPWTFTRICRHWRAVAFNTPRLWTSVFFNPDAVSLRSFMGQEICRTSGELQRAFQRSKALPIKLSIRFTPSFDSRILSPIVDAVAGRIQDLELTTYSHDSTAAPIGLPVDFITQPLGSLNKLTVWGHLSPIFCRNLITLINDTALDFRALRLTKVPPELSSCSALWSRVTEMDVDETVVHSILPLCSNLRVLCLLSNPQSNPQFISGHNFSIPKLEKVSGIHPHSFFSRISTNKLRILSLTRPFQTPRTSPPINLPSLLHLEIKARSRIYLDTFTVPMLKNLIVSDSTIFQSRNGEILTKNLESLILEGVRSNTNVLTGLLEANKGLKVLQLDGAYNIPYVIIERLNLPNSTSSLEESGMYVCPLLKTLRVKISKHNRSIQKSLEEMLAALVIRRQVANIHLDELAYYCYLDEQEGHWMDLVKISEGILEVSLVHD